MLKQVEEVRDSMLSTTTARGLLKLVYCSLPKANDGRLLIQLHSDWCAVQEALCKWIDTIQYNTKQYNKIQYNTIQYKPVQYNTIQCNTR